MESATGAFEKFQAVRRRGAAGARPTRSRSRRAFAEDLDADSLDLVELVMALEETFDIEVDETELEGI